MTKKKIVAIGQRLKVDCDEPFMFASMVGKSGGYTICKAGSGGALFTLLINLIEKIMETVSDDKELKTALASALISYLEES